MEEIRLGNKGLELNKTKYKKKEKQNKTKDSGIKELYKGKELVTCNLFQNEDLSSQRCRFIRSSSTFPALSKMP